MSRTADSLTPSNLLAAASEVLVASGYQISGASSDWETLTTRLFEDAYNVVGIAVFETCGELLRGWADIQGSLVNTISRYIGKGESKSWDGYLVLLTPGLAPSTVSEIEAVKYNTTRVRKLVATGEELKSIRDVERVLRPLLPLTNEQIEIDPQSVLELLPKLLLAHDVPEATSRLLIDAFEANVPMLERLHEQEGKK